MSEDLLPQVGDEQAAEQDSPENDKMDAELARVRKEAANYRVKLREIEAKWKEAEPVLSQYQAQQEAQKTEAQKLAEQLQALRQQLSEQETAAAQAQRLATLTKMATRMGVDPDLVELLDTSKLDLADEKAVNAVLAKLVMRAPATGSNPNRAGSDAETLDARRARLFQRNSRSTLLGG